MHPLANVPRVDVSDWDKELYSIRLMPAGHYRIVKFDGMFNVIKINYVWRKSEHTWDCTCERACISNECRHRMLRRLFDSEGKTGTGWFLDFNTREWEPPIDSPLRKYQQLRQMKERSNGTEIQRRTASGS